MRVTKRRVVAVMLLAILMLVLMAGTAWAGVDPSTTLDPKGSVGQGHRMRWRQASTCCGSSSAPCS